MDPQIWLIAFAAMFALDVSWVLYMRASNRGQPVRSALWALAIHGFGAASVISYTTDPRYLSATMLGTVLGTWAVVRWTKDKVE